MHQRLFFQAWYLGWCHDALYFSCEVLRYYFLCLLRCRSCPSISLALSLILFLYVSFHKLLQAHIRWFLSQWAHRLAVEHHIFRAIQSLMHWWFPLKRGFLLVFRLPWLLYVCALQYCLCWPIAWISLLDCILFAFEQLLFFKRSLAYWYYAQFPICHISSDVLLAWTNVVAIADLLLFGTSSLSQWSMLAEWCALILQWKL